MKLSILWLLVEVVAAVVLLVAVVLVVTLLVLDIQSHQVHHIRLQ
jgi:hypothetical protein